MFHGLRQSDSRPCMVVIHKTVLIVTGVAWILSALLAAQSVSAREIVGNSMDSAFQSQHNRRAATATATVTLTILPPPPAFSKSFSPATIHSGSTSRLTFTIDNTANAVAIGGVAFTDLLPADLFIASPASAIDNCSGTLTAPPGGSSISFTGGNVEAGASCELSLDVVASIPGTYLNISGELSSEVGTSDAASATLQVGATINVDSFVDIVATDGLCTLREAITNANANADTTDGDCPPGYGADRIILGTGAYIVGIAGTNEDLNATGDFDLTDSQGLTIKGDDARTTIIDGNRVDRVFDVQSLASFTLEGVTVQHGSVGRAGVGGGGIRSQGVLELSEVRVHANQSRAVGGGLLIMGGSTLIRQCLFDANEAHILAEASGGAIAVVSETGTTIIENSTISGNSAAARYGGALSHLGLSDVLLSYVTLTSNSSGVFQTGKGLLTLMSSIVSGNGGGECQGVITSGGYNVFGADYDSGGCPTPVGGGDIIPGGSTGTVIDIVLADNGGSTDSHDVFFGSPAVDLIPAADNGCGTTFVKDQRGLVRPYNGSCDSGACEGPVEIFQIFGDGFESGDIAGWSYSSDSRSE